MSSLQVLRLLGLYGLQRRQRQADFQVVRTRGRVADLHARDSLRLTLWVVRTLPLPPLTRTGRPQPDVFRRSVSDRCAGRPVPCAEGTPKRGRSPHNHKHCGRKRPTAALGPRGVAGARAWSQRGMWHGCAVSRWTRVVFSTLLARTASCSSPAGGFMPLWADCGRG